MTQSTETTLEMIGRIQAMPHTHKVITTFMDGTVREFTTRSERTAKNHAVLERRKIGRILLERGSNNEIMIVSVEIREIGR